MTIREIDSRIIAYTQDAYLWLFDRTGIFVGSVMMVFIGTMLLSGWTMSSSPSMRALLIIGILVLMLQAGHRYHQQALAELAFNRTSIAYREFWRLRTTISIIFLFFGVTDLSIGSFASSAYDLAMIPSFYCDCILIRERKPKDWLPSSPKLAQQAGAA